MQPRSILITLLLLVGCLAFADAAKRLILKDGSYQSVTKWEVEGDRVRYMSAERFEWEEMPNNLIDWPATEKYNRRLSSDVSHSAQQIDKEVEEEKQEELERTPEVAPRLRLPEGGGVLVLDYYHGEPELVELEQATSEIEADRKGNILRAAINPLASQKSKIEVPGVHSKVQIHVPRPAIYVNVEDTQTKAKSADSSRTDDSLANAPTKPQRYRLVKMNATRDSRVLGNLKVSMTGKTSQEQSFIPTQGEPMTGGWVKVTPTQDLPPGEYAVVEMLGEKEMNLYVWDLGVNPAAPESVTAMKPETDVPARRADEKLPELNKRPKP